MSATMQEHLRESMFKTALFHFLKNSKKSPERTARNIEELLNKFHPSPCECRIKYDELLQLIRTSSMEECISYIMDKVS